MGLILIPQHLLLRAPLSFLLPSASEAYDLAHRKAVGGTDAGTSQLEQRPGAMVYCHILASTLREPVWVHYGPKCTLQPIRLEPMAQPAQTPSASTRIMLLPPRQRVAAPPLAWPGNP